MVVRVQLYAVVNLGGGIYVMRVHGFGLDLCVSGTCFFEGNCKCVPVLNHTTLLYCDDAMCRPFIR